MLPIMPLESAAGRSKHENTKGLDETRSDSNGMMGSMMQDLAFAIPGVDEAMSFAEIMKSVSRFFTAETPHLLQIPLVGM